ncbi:PEP-CTERM/exosortase system-associated acyltransferase [Psychrosphaera sp.]|nr:PEP-CTERM/exosortase system-associated acyltransferase [Psychrosphaera sp.]
MNLIKKLSNNALVGKYVRYLLQILVNSKAKKIAAHFARYLQPTIANTENLKKVSYELRHSVYCEELGFEECREDRLEIDEFDPQSLHCLIQHKSSNKYAGTVRVVCSKNDSELLPIEKYCLDSIDNDEYHPSKFPRNKISEISRLAVPAEFRRRKIDQHKGSATGAINPAAYSEKELRCFPFIAVGLYFAAASIVLKNGIDHVYVMMEPRLARSLSMVGINFVQIGPVVDYHGKRAPYYIDPNSLNTTLKPGFLELFRRIQDCVKNDKIDDALNFEAEEISGKANGLSFFNLSMPIQK